MLSMALRPAVVWSDAREDGSKEVWGPSRKEHLSCILKVKVLDEGRHHAIYHFLFFLYFFAIYYFKGKYMYPIEDFTKTM